MNKWMNKVMKQCHWMNEQMNEQSNETNKCHWSLRVCYARKLLRIAYTSYIYIWCTFKLYTLYKVHSRIIYNVLFNIYTANPADMSCWLAYLGSVLNKIYFHIEIVKQTDNYPVIIQELQDRHKRRNKIEKQVILSTYTFRFVL